MNKEAEASFLAGVDKALLIALATPVAYVVAFQYDRGYLNFFGLPDVMVDVSLRDLLIVAVTIASVGYSLYVALESVLVILPEQWPPQIRRRVLGLFWTTVALVVVRNVFDMRGSIFAGAVALIVLLCVCLVAIPLRGKRDAAVVASAVDSTKQSPRPDPYAHKGVIPAMLRRGVERRLIVGIFGVVVAGSVANLVGDAQARMQTSFLVHQSEIGTSCAVIRMRDTDLLCADFDIGTHRVTGDYHLLKSEGTMLSLRKTGRLQEPEATKTPQSPK